MTLDSSGLAVFRCHGLPARRKPGGTTSPEEMIAAAPIMLRDGTVQRTGEGRQSLQPETKAEVDFQPGVGITEIRLHVKGDVPGLDAQGFEAAAEDAKRTAQ